MTRTTGSRMGLLVLLGAVAVLAAAAPDGSVQSPSSRPVRVLLGSVPRELPIPIAGRWKLVDENRRVVASAESPARWSVMREGDRLRVIHADAPASPWV